MSKPEDAKSIFLAAAEKPAGNERIAFLDGACAGDPQLRRRVEALLTAHDQPDSFLERPVVDAGREAATVPIPAVAQPGAVIGPYKLLQEIGEGGMGVVYLAEQTEPVRRKVALKIIKPGMDTRQVIARFEAERQAVAMMEHQNIARVLDAGTTGSSDAGQPGGPYAGRPYFVMELVKGIPITEYCDRNRLSTRERLELFTPVCQAIQHAHQKGVIHRDIKPSNVLVCLYDGKPVPKVIDFGVAKAMEQPLTEKTMFTQHGQVVGTLEYMSPEQAEVNQLDVDTRSDIYSLGVLLYELLTGSTPIPKEKLREAAFVEILRTICEEEPEPPSTRLSHSGDALPTLSAQRKTEPRKLSALVRGELDWIVMKTLEKDRTRRYESAAAVAADIQRHLNNEPVTACPPSVVYKFRKFAHKHRAALATAVAFAALLLVGAAISVWQAVRATRAERQVRQALVSEAGARRAADLDRQRAVSAEQKAGNERDAAQRARDQEAAARQQAESAGRETQAVLAKSLFEQARAVRLAGEFGRRWHGLELLEQSGHLRSQVGQWHHDELPTLTQLRSEALSALLLQDGRVIGEWPCLFPAISPDGRFGASTWLDMVHRTGCTRIIDLATGEMSRETHGLESAVSTILAVGPDGKLLARRIRDSGSNVHRIAIEDSASGNRIRELQQPVPVEADKASPVQPVRQPSVLQHAAFSPDGHYLAGVDFWPGDTRVILWDLTSDEAAGQIIATVELPPALAFKPDGRILAFAKGDNAIACWNLSDARIEKEIALEFTTTGSLGFTPDGNELAVLSEPGGAGSALVYCDAASGREVARTVTKNLMSVSQVAFSRDGQHVALADLRGTLHVFNRRKESPPVILDHGSMVRELGWDCTGRHLISASQSAFKVWEFAQNLPLVHQDLSSRDRRIGPAGSRHAVFAFSPDGRWLALRSATEGEVTLVDRKTRQTVRTLQPADKSPGETRSLTFSPDNETLVCLTAQSIIAWDVETGQPRFQRTVAEFQARDINSIGISADGNIMAAGATDTLPTVWDAATGQIRWQGSEDEYSKASVSLDARRFVVSPMYFLSGQTNATLAVVDLAEHRELYRMEQPPLQMMVDRSIEWSPDGRWIATFERNASGVQMPAMVAPLSGKWTVDVRHAATGGKHLEFELASSPIGYAFSPDGRNLAVAARDGTVHFWDVDQSEHVFDWSAWPATDGSLPASELFVVRHLAFTPDGKSLAILDPEHDRLQYLDLEQVNGQLGALGLGW